MTFYQRSWQGYAKPLLDFAQRRHQSISFAFYNVLRQDLFVGGRNEAVCEGCQYCHPSVELVARP